MAGGTDLANLPVPAGTGYRYRTDRRPADPPVSPWTSISLYCKQLAARIAAWSELTNVTHTPSRFKGSKRSRLFLRFSYDRRHAKREAAHESMID
jgi:hypothetical protein